MTRFASIAQAAYITILFALLCAKIPSFTDVDAAKFSILGAIVGAGIALVAIAIGSVLSPLAESAEQKGTEAQLALMRGAMISIAEAATSFTAFLYIRYD